MQANKKTILVVEDDKKIRLLLTQLLVHEGYNIQTASNKKQALAIIHNTFVHLVLLDWMLGAHDGIEIFREVHANNKHRDIPFIMLTARTSIEDQVYGLDKGVVDYICKPFQAAMLLARIRSCLLHHPRTSEHVIVCKAYTLMVDSGQLHYKNTHVQLSDTDCRLLAFLMQKQGIALSRMQLLDVITRSHQYIELRTVDVHISRLRKKIPVSNASEVIQTIHGKGYMFIANT